MELTKVLSKGLYEEWSCEELSLLQEWLGKEDLWKIYLASDLFILPSLNEGMPNAMLEAMGAGLPCLGSNIPGIRDILYHDELLFDPFDKGTFTAKIQKILSAPRDFDQVKELCRRRKIQFMFDWKGKLYQLVEQEIFS